MQGDNPEPGLRWYCTDVRIPEDRNSDFQKVRERFRFVIPPEAIGFRFAIPAEANKG